MFVASSSTCVQLEDASCQDTSADGDDGVFAAATTSLADGGSSHTDSWSGNVSSWAQRNERVVWRFRIFEMPEKIKRQRNLIRNRYETIKHPVLQQHPTLSPYVHIFIFLLLT